MRGSILGIICGLYTYIWGWINADAKGLKKTMINWTIAIIAQIILQVGAAVMGASSAPQLPSAP